MSTFQRIASFLTGNQSNTEEQKDFGSHSVKIELSDSEAVDSDSPQEFFLEEVQVNEGNDDGSDSFEESQISEINVPDSPEENGQDRKEVKRNGGGVINSGSEEEKENSDELEEKEDEAKREEQEKRETSKLSLENEDEEDEQEENDEDSLNELFEDASPEDRGIELKNASFKLMEQNIYNEREFKKYKLFSSFNWRTGKRIVKTTGDFSSRLKHAMEIEVRKSQNFQSTILDSDWKSFLEEHKQVIVLPPPLDRFKIAIDLRTLQLVHFKLLKDFRRNRLIRVATTAPRIFCTIVSDVLQVDNYDQIYSVMTEVNRVVRLTILRFNPTLRRSNSTFRPKTVIRDEDGPHDRACAGSIILGRNAEPIFGVPIFRLSMCTRCREATVHHELCEGGAKKLRLFQDIFDTAVRVRLKPEDWEGLDLYQPLKLLEPNGALHSPAKLLQNFKRKKPDAEEPPLEPFRMMLKNCAETLFLKIEASIEKLCDGFESGVGTSSGEGYFKYVEGGENPKAHYEHYTSKEHDPNDFIRLFEDTEGLIYTLLFISNHKPDLEDIRAYYYDQTLEPSRSALHFKTQNNGVKRVRSLYGPRLLDALMVFFTFLRQTYLEIGNKSKAKYLFFSNPSWDHIKSLLGYHLGYAEFEVQFKRLYELHCGSWDIPNEVYDGLENSPDTFASLALLKKCLEMNSAWYSAMMGNVWSSEAYASYVERIKKRKTLE